MFLSLAVLSFLFLTFMTIDAACLCRRFIQYLSEAPTEYTPATTDYFSRLRGDVDRRYLDEWIDLQLIEGSRYFYTTPDRGIAASLQDLTRLFTGKPACEAWSKGRAGV